MMFMKTSSSGLTVEVTMAEIVAFDEEGSGAGAMTLGV